MQNKELKLCPFCGGKAKLIKANYDLEDIYWIRCKKCGVDSNIFYTSDTAIEAWNRRVEDAN